MVDPNDPITVRIALEPVGRRTTVLAGITVLEATRHAGVELVAVCGGLGICETCRVQIVEGSVSPLTVDEENALSEAERASGLRLACQVNLLEDVRIHIPAESLAAPQRLQLEGRDTGIKPDPPVFALDVRIEPPDLDDLRSDATRIGDQVAASGFPRPSFTIPVLTAAAGQLRDQNWSVRLALAHHEGKTEVIGILPEKRPLYGVAFDMGTTKLAGYLVDLESGTISGKEGAMNPQIAFGEDVVSRIAYANRTAAHKRELQTRIVGALNTLVDKLCSDGGIDKEQIVSMVAVGNTAMHHLFAGLPVKPLGESPYVPALSDAVSIRAGDLDLDLEPGTMVYLPPNIAGYVGADHVAMLLATDVCTFPDETVIALDIGTNTEISLITGDQLWCCSCASGPAFEGAHIENGMRAAPGAIERVLPVEDTFRVHTINDLPPVGICGSGILDAIAALKTSGLLDQRGSLLEKTPRIRRDGVRVAFVLVDGSETGHGHDIVVTRSDVHEIQLAKGAIRTGIDILLKEANIPAYLIDRFIVAGAFGTYLSLESAIEIGMFPDLPLNRFYQVGNAAGMGAVQMLISRERRRLAQDMARNIKYIELTTYPDFHETYIQSLFF